MATTVGSAERKAGSTGIMEQSPERQAYRLLQLGFVVAPVIAGLDKFFNVLVDWPQYLSPIIADNIGATGFMMVVGVVEIAAGIGVALKPRVFGYVVALWLLAIIVNLLLVPGYYDVALRDLGLAIGATAMARLAARFDS